jgi:hypothetical protein
MYSKAAPCATQRLTCSIAVMDVAAEEVAAKGTYGAEEIALRLMYSVCSGTWVLL